MPEDDIPSTPFAMTKTDLISAISLTAKNLRTLIYKAGWAFDNKNYIPFSNRKGDGKYLVRGHNRIRYVDLKNETPMLSCVDWGEDWTGDPRARYGFIAHSYPLDMFNEHELYCVNMWLNEFYAETYEEIRISKIREEEEKKRKDAEDAMLAKMTFMERYAYQRFGITSFKKVSL